MPTIKLTKTAIDSIPLPDGNSRVWYWDTELIGFGVRVSKTDKTFYAKLKSQVVKIGKFGQYTPDKARKEAIKILAKLNEGVDINKEKAITRTKGMTLEDALDKYFEAKPQLRGNTIITYKCLLSTWLSDWMDSPIKNISQADIAKRHLDIAEKRTAATANNVMRTFRAIYNHAQIIAESTLPENPTKRLSSSRQWFKVERRQTVIKEHDLKPWFNALITYPNPVSVEAIFLLLLTGCRENEMLTLEWDNVDLKDRTFIIKAEIAKNHKAHTLPMSDLIYNIFKQRSDLKENNWVFSSTGETGHLIDVRRAVEFVTKKSNVEFCLHDLRRTFTGIAEQEVSYAVLKRLLNHYTGNDVTAGYLVISTEQLREPMQKITNKIVRAIERLED